MNHGNGVIPEPILQLQRQLEQFRSTRPRRTKLPESLWQSAVELARQHGVYPVAHPLRLDYVRLKQRLGGVPRRRRKTATPTFVEFAPVPSSIPQECVIEFESAGGSKMRIHWKTPAPDQWLNLLRAWRDTEK